ncbi:hypothetical protein C8Q80DRAFT_1215554 [Daedaleopsis nitida]|nr:hypothetical protein C8Q80DRAFT_1215554 [Daedaleopsis nitida]
MNVMNSPVDLRAHDDHLKNLLGQRAARADLHGRYPSLSEFSDSPSVYSHPHFSPRPPDRPFLDGTPHSFRFPPSPNLYSPTLSEPRSPISDRERLNIPNASSLDLEDDPRSSLELDSLHDEQGDSPEETEEEELPRISMYGPKMRFHSPAPWEEDDIDAKPMPEEPFRRSKKKSDTGKKGWGLSRANQESRPSNDSSRSGSKGKQSIDAASIYSANGALAALAQASMSSTSLGIQQSPQSLKDKLSLPRLRSRTPSNVGHTDSVPSANVSPVSRIGTPPHVESYADDHHSSARAGTPQHEYTHPYANPDLASFVDHDLPPPSSSHMAFGAIQSDSNATLTDTTPSSSLSQFRSTTTFSMTPGTSTTSVNPSLNDSTSSTRAINKGISSPMPVDKTSLHPDALSKLNGYPQSPMTPVVGPNPVVRNRDTAMGGLSAWENSSALKLISLEEAQAQARERARSQTAHPIFSSPFAGPAKPLMLDTDLDAHRVQGRARSSSAGGKGRMITDNPSDSPVSGPPRQVARKKSGFMRLFNGKERVSPSSLPPPVPMFSADAFAANPPPPPPQYSRSRQTTSHRVPVPSLSPSIGGDGSNMSVSPLESPPTSSNGSGSTGSSSSGMREQQELTARRKVPELSIVTTSSSMNLTAKAPHTAPLSAGSSEMTHHHLTPTLPAGRTEGLRSNGSSPSSAPPMKTDFVGLSIRPLSTLFTRELKDLAVHDDASSRMRPSLEVDTGTPTTATTGTTAISPLSPDFPGMKGVDYGRSSDEQFGHIAYAHDDRDQSNVIQALQEQILSSRRAWQRQIWELEGQVRDLKAEVEELRVTESSSEYCITCGRGAIGRPSGDDAGNGRTLEGLRKAGVKVGGVVNRPRARTGVGSRFASGT